jgi:hypothetical protein
LTPNGNGFSRIVDQSDENSVRSFHIWAQIMISNSDGNSDLEKLINHYTFEPNRYNKDYRTSLEKYKKTDEQFTFSNIDNDPQHNDGSVIQKTNEQVVPVFKRPTYVPFGMSYRRCAGEVFVYYMTDKILERFSDLSFQFHPIDTDKFENLKMKLKRNIIKNFCTF